VPFTVHNAVLPTPEKHKAMTCLNDVTIMMTTGRLCGNCSGVYSSLQTPKLSCSNTDISTNISGIDTIVSNWLLRDNYVSVLTGVLYDANILLVLSDEPRFYYPRTLLSPNSASSSRKILADLGNNEI
jgi:hypothetical protein